MNSFQQIAAFAYAARHGSFAAAARELGQSPSTIAKSVSRLERRLGVRLFHRTTRRVSLTADGEQLFAHGERILDEVEQLQSVAAGARGAPSGTLRIDVPVTFGRRFVLPVVVRLLAAHPQLSAEVRLSDRQADVIREGLDAVVRIGALPDSRLVVRPFARQQLVVCASPAYLKRRGEPRAPADVTEHDCGLFRMPTTGRDRPWQFRVGRKPLELQPQARLRLGEGEALVEAACAGFGLVQVPDYMAADALREGRLREVLADFRPAPLAISLVYPGSRLVPPRVRALIGALAGEGRPAAPVLARGRSAQQPRRRP